MTLSLWDLVPAARPEFDEEPDCPSVLYPASTALELGWRRCTVNHVETRQVLHGKVVAGNPTWWTDEAAARSKADYFTPTGPLCLECSREAKSRGLCASCAAGELTRDDIEIEDAA